jgi:predicted amidohydrolase YtcJ
MLRRRAKKRRSQFVDDIKECSVMTAPRTTIFTNGAVFDGIAVRDRGTVVVVEDERIVAVTSDRSAADKQGADRVDLDGGLLLPGFVDAHVHPIEGGLERMRCDLSGASDRAGYLAVISEYAAATPNAPWILGGGWQLAAFPGGSPDLDGLDAIVPDRPVFLSNRDHHGAWVNSRALELAGITAETRDPADGTIERHPDGTPNGVLQEGARLLVSRFIPEDTADENYAALMGAQRYLHSLGVTGWQDAIVGDYGNHSDTGDIYLRAARNGDLTARVVAALWWDRTRGLDQLDGLVARRAELHHSRFSASSVKIMQDGIPENRTAALVDPYLIPESVVAGCRCGTPHYGTETGLSFFDPAELPKIVTELDRKSFQVHVHAIGDRAVREALDAFESALAANGATGNRHHIAHVQIVNPADLGRFAKLDVAANIQALWATFDPQMVELNVPFLGEQRSAWQYPFADLQRSGAHLAAGSDWPVTTPDPWAAIHVAVNRTLPQRFADYTPRRFYPNQALDLASALRAYTSGSSRINHHDDAGRIEPGADADLVITNRNPFAHSGEEIGDTSTRETWVRGTRVYSS